MTPILAASEIELIIGAIVFVIWIVGALASKLKGSPQESQQPGEPTPLERMQQQIAEQIRSTHGYAAPPPPLPPPVPTGYQQPTRQWPAPEAPQQQQQRQTKQRQKKQKQQRPVFADVPPPPLPKSSPVVAAPLAPRPASIAAPQIRRWLTPATLRQQFILTELFQPPLSMREDR